MFIKTQRPIPMHQLSMIVPSPWTHEDFDSTRSWKVAWDSAGICENIIWWKEKNWNRWDRFWLALFWQKMASLPCQEPKSTGLGFLRQSSRWGIECSHLGPWAQAWRQTSFPELWKVLRSVCVAQSRPDSWRSFSNRKENAFRQCWFAVCLSITWTSHH